MSKSPPGVRRIVSILNFFADHPEQSFTLTDLVRALRLSHATCHGLLVGLVEAGYLYRANDKSYVLGPALAAIGEVAKDHFSPLQVAQSEIRALADEFGVTCMATFRENQDVVVRDRAVGARTVGASIARGTRLPLLPQFAGLFFVSSTPAEVRAWTREIDPPLSDEQQKAMMKSIEFIRRHGFLAGVWEKRQEEFDGDAAWIHKMEYARAPIRALFEINPDAEYDLTFLQAPVYDSLHHPAFVIGLQGFGDKFKGVEIERMAKRIRDACDRVSGFMARATSRS